MLQLLFWAQVVIDIFLLPWLVYRVFRAGKKRRNKAYGVEVASRAQKVETARLIKILKRR